MRLVTIGTGTVVPDGERASACYWLEEAASRALIDCGAGALQGLARCSLPWGRIDHLLISHFHADHIGEIPSLIFAMKHGQAQPRREPLAVWGPAGTRRVFDALAQAYGDWLVEPGFELTIRELRPGERLSIGEWVGGVAKTPHTDESLAYRLEGDGAIFGYTGDTGPSTELANFLHGVDLLLAECSLPDDLVGENHLSPTRLARLATESGARRLAVTHVYPQLRRRDVPGLIRSGGYDGEIIMVEDGQDLQI